MSTFKVSRKNGATIIWSAEFKYTPGKHVGDKAWDKLIADEATKNDCLDYGYRVKAQTSLRSYKTKAEAQAAWDKGLLVGGGTTPTVRIEGDFNASQRKQIESANPGLVIVWDN